jgi:two-component system response regulator YesN
MERRHSPLTFREIALARVFQQATGTTFISRLLDLRLEQSRRLLLDSILSITEISLRVGYHSFSHFSRVFKEVIGVLPSNSRHSEGQSWRK